MRAATTDDLVVDERFMWLSDWADGQIEFVVDKVDGHAVMHNQSNRSIGSGQLQGRVHAQRLDTHR